MCCRGAGYTWNQTVYDVGGDGYINTKFSDQVTSRSDQVTFGFQMDMCRNVSKMAYPTTYIVSMCLCVSYIHTY